MITYKGSKGDKNDTFVRSLETWYGPQTRGIGEAGYLFGRSYTKNVLEKAQNSRLENREKPFIPDFGRLRLRLQKFETPKECQEKNHIWFCMLNKFFTIGQEKLISC